MNAALPQMLRVEQFAESAGLNRCQAYDLVRKMPPGVVIRLNRRVRLDAEKLRAWLAAGGSSAG